MNERVRASAVVLQVGRYHNIAEHLGSIRFFLSGQSQYFSIVVFDNEDLRTNIIPTLSYVVATALVGASIAIPRIGALQIASYVRPGCQSEASRE